MYVNTRHSCHFFHLDLAPCGEARSKWALSDRFCPVFPWGRGESFFVFLSIFYSQPRESSDHLSRFGYIRFGLTQFALKWRRQTPFASSPLAAIPPCPQCDEDSIWCMEEDKEKPSVFMGLSHLLYKNEPDSLKALSLPEGRIWIYNAN